MSVQIEIVPSLDDVPAAQWDALTGDGDPFVEHAFLRALETSGSVGPRTGWSPCHVLVRRDGELAGAAPLYAKTNSYGEYIFDWAWANAASQLGTAYYPKLVSAVPFTPATGRRLLVADGATSGEVVDALLAGMSTMVEEVDASSLHLLFVTEAERTSLADNYGLLPRLTYQYHWENQGYATFEDYLSTFRHGARRQVKKERREAMASGLEIRTLTGDEITDEIAATAYRFYRDTTARKGAIAYLTADFYAELARSLKHRAVLNLATDAGRPVAGALSFAKGGYLFGRYWGCIEDYDKLHFELCYYANLALCIDRGWTRFEAGAQGQHKIKRGLMPSPTYSAHWLRHEELRDAIANYLPREAAQNQYEMRMLAERGPFKRG